ncbi:hypothetical protein BS78_02G022600 [Paspalum vaginatum]|nr:hypothetical protein BS78_02G022600 [Paspalum vaginatum]
MDGDSGSNPNPNPLFIRASINGRECDVTVQYYSAYLERRRREEEERGLRRPGIFSPRSSPSSSRRTDRGQRSELATTTRIRQSSMYSDRPRRSRGNRAQLPSNSPAVEVATEGSNNELGPTTIADAAPSLSDSPPALDRTDGTRPRSERATQTHVRQSSMYSDRPWRSRGNRGRAQQSTNLPATEVAAEDRSTELGPTIADVSYLETLSLSDSPLAPDPTDGSEKPCERAGLQAPTFDNMDDAFEYLWNSCRVAIAAMYPPASVDKSEHGSELILEQEARSVPAPEQALAISIPAIESLGEWECSEDSDEEIAENGKKWMREEVMVAFKKYIEGNNDFKGILYEFDELQHQCFSVENYHKIFHHFNFTVKTKAHESADWVSMLFFAEVKEILRQKIYFCSPLEPDENGHCYACKMQGMDDLRHPIIGVYDRGSPDTTFPLMYGGDPSAFVCGCCY